MDNCSSTSSCMSFVFLRTHGLTVENSLCRKGEQTACKERSIVCAQKFPKKVRSSTTIQLS